MKKCISRYAFLAAVFLCASVHAQQWPHPFPCRIGNSANRDLFVMTLGDVKTPLAQGVFDPLQDRVTLNDGKVLNSYFRDSLRVAFFKPIDKHIFGVPPSGWCSWYYYYQEVSADEIRLNAKWMADHLKPFGAEYIQIDDGWQGTGHGLGDNRDWTTIDKRFPGGMDKLAGYIKTLGMIPGLWLAPHGQSSDVVVKANPEVFLLRSDSVHAFSTWEGIYLVDPTTKETHEYLNRLFTTLTGWGYEYFKIDGQPIVMEQYKRNFMKMKYVPEDPVAAYRGTIRTIQEAIGDKRFLLGCWGIPLEGAGIMNGARTGGDISPGWKGFIVALDATMKYYYQHNVLWYTDPDVMLLRKPLTLDQARAWATLQGLTGQALLANDRMPDLTDDRVEIARRVFPAVDIRPLDLFPANGNKRIWDLKVHHLGQAYDVVGVFNFNEKQNEHTLLRWEDLGLPKGGRMHVYDFWNREYLGSWEDGIGLEIPPTSCRVLTLLPETDAIQLISTSRHITQGWIDLMSLSFNNQKNSFEGRSKLVANDPYELRFVFPRGKNYRVKNATADGLKVEIRNHQGWATVSFIAKESSEISWGVEFEPADMYTFTPNNPPSLSVQPHGITGVSLSWDTPYYNHIGYELSLDGKNLGWMESRSFTIHNLDPRTEHSFRLYAVWEDGTRSKNFTEAKYNPAAMMKHEYSLSELEPVSASCGWGSLGLDKSVNGTPLSIGGKKFARGIGTHANSAIEYELYGMFSDFSATVGVDDESNEQGSVEFIVSADGRELWRSGIMKKADGGKNISLPLKGVQKLLLRVTDGGDGMDSDHADWGGIVIKFIKL